MDSQNKEHTLKKVMVLGAIAVVMVSLVAVNNQGNMQQASSSRSVTSQTAMNLSANPANDMSMVGKTNYLSIEDESGQAEESISGKTKIKVEKISSATTMIDGGGTNDDTGFFVITYRITAVGGDVYVPVGTVNGDVDFLVQRKSNGNILSLSGVNSVVTSNGFPCTVTVNNNCRVNEGEIVTFKLTTVVELPTIGTAGNYRIKMNGISWAKTDLPQLNIAKVFMYPYRTDWIYLN